MTGIKLIVFIIERGRSNELLELCHEEGVSFTAAAHGMGTASREILSLLGIGDTDKDVVILSVGADRAEAVMDTLAGRMHLERPGGGVAFSIPFSAIVGQMTSAELFAGTLEPEPPKRKNPLARRKKGGSTHADKV